MLCGSGCCCKALEGYVPTLQQQVMLYKTYPMRSLSACKNTLPMGTSTPSKRVSKEFDGASLPDTWMEQRKKRDVLLFQREDVVVSGEAHARQGRRTLQLVRIGLTCGWKQCFLSGDSTQFIISDITGDSKHFTSSDFRFDVTRCRAAVAAVAVLSGAYARAPAG